MRYTSLFVLILGLGLSVPALADKIDGGAVIGGAIGGATGAAVGSAVGGKEGAIIGGAIGGGTGAAIGSKSGDTKEKVVVKKTVVIVDDHDNGKKLGHHKNKHKHQHGHGHDHD